MAVGLLRGCLRDRTMTYRDFDAYYTGFRIKFGTALSVPTRSTPPPRADRCTATLARTGSAPRRLPRPCCTAVIRALPYCTHINAVGSAILRDPAAALASVAALEPPVVLAHLGVLWCLGLGYRVAGRVRVYVCGS